MTRLIAELGSTHCGKLERIKEAIDKCKELNIDALKLQLFPDEKTYTDVGNIFLPRDHFSTAFEYAASRDFVLSASVFDQDSFEFLLAKKPAFIKFSYGKKDQTEWIRRTLDAGIEAIVSCDLMSRHLVNDRATTLYCIPEYPVLYKVDFNELFSIRYPFDGFSDHTMGVKQTRKAIRAGAQIIEKHVRLGYSDETCPDARFAVTIEEFAGVRR